MAKTVRDIDKMFEIEKVWGKASNTIPFETTKSYLLDRLDDPEVPKAQRWTKVELVLLRLAIGSIQLPLDMGFLHQANRILITKLFSSTMKTI